MSGAQFKQDDALNSAGFYNSYAARFKRWNETSGITPTVEKNEGIRPDSYLVAPYLSVKRYIDYSREWVVVGAGHAMSCDSNGFLVHSGLKRQCQAMINACIDAAGAVDFATDPTGSTLDRYSASDLSAGVKNSAGVTPTVGEPVAWSLLTAALYSAATTADVSAVANPIGKFIGALVYDAKQSSGTDSSYDPYNPTTLRYHNFQSQVGISVLCDYVLELPVEPFERAQATAKAADYNGSVVATDADIVQDLNGIGATDVAISVALTGHNGDLIAGSFVVTKNGIKLRSKGSALVAGDEDIYYFLDVSTNPDSVKVRGNENDTFLIDFLYTKSPNVYNAPYSTLGVFRGSAVCGTMVTYDDQGKFVPHSNFSYAAVGNGKLTDGLHNEVNFASASPGDSAAELGAELVAVMNAMKDKQDEVVGQIIRVDSDFPKDYLERVRTSYDPILNGVVIDPDTGEERTLDRMPGTATGGLPANVYLAGGDAGTGVVSINLHTR
jgi:hypothetical protein